MKRIFTVLLMMSMIIAMAMPAVVHANGQAGTTLEARVTATAHWTITYGWTIDKSVSPDSWTFYPGESGISTYTITVAKDNGTEEAWIEGIVTVTNGGERATENLTILIELRNGVPPPKDLIATAIVDVSGNPVLDPGETGEYPYRIDIPSANVHACGEYKVTACVTITNHSGYLGEPFGPSPSATTNLPNSPTLVNDVIHVDDTNGGSWEFSTSSSVTYDVLFVYCQEGEHVNRATIRETGQYDEAVVTITCVIPPQAIISGVKFFDTDLDGQRDPDEVGIEDWKIELYKWNETSEAWYLYDTTFTDGIGNYVFTASEVGRYKIVEVMPSGMWIQTAPEDGYYEFDVALGETYTDKDFGNVCLKPGYGGKTLGFWSNKNGQALINSSDVTALNGLNLYKPSGWSYPPFSSDLATAKTQIKNYLLSATAVDMRWMLSAQLIATKLNVLHGFLSSGTTVYVGSSSYVPTGFITIGEIINNANTALHGNDRAEQEYWKNLLDGLNNNMLPFVCPEPCYPVVYP
ncbi:MAG: SdrD B-like domain-containing protein [Candidatus Bathyarchaeia archaeon]